MAESHSPVYMDRVFFVQSSIEEHVGCFHPWPPWTMPQWTRGAYTFVNKWLISVFRVDTQKSHVGHTVAPFEETPYRFHSGCQFTSCQQRMGPLFLRIPSHTCYFCLVDSWLFHFLSVCRFWEYTSLSDITFSRPLHFKVVCHIKGDEITFKLMFPTIMIFLPVNEKYCDLKSPRRP